MRKEAVEKCLSGKIGGMTIAARALYLFGFKDSVRSTRLTVLPFCDVSDIHRVPLRFCCEKRRKPLLFARCSHGTCCPKRNEKGSQEDTSSFLPFPDAVRRQRRHFQRTLCRKYDAPKRRIPIRLCEGDHKKDVRAMGADIIEIAMTVYCFL